MWRRFKQDDHIQENHRILLERRTTKLGEHFFFFLQVFGTLCNSQSKKLKFTPFFFSFLIQTIAKIILFPLPALQAKYSMLYLD